MNAERNPKVPERWWESATGMKLITLKRGEKYNYAHPVSLEPRLAAQELDAIKAQGFDAVEIFAPAHGRYAYNGLDTVDHYAIDPEAGTMDDFRRFVALAHERAIAVIAFINVGYFALDAPDWLEACRDRNGSKASWFWWTETADAPIPAENEYFNRPRAMRDEVKTWGWQYSEAAGRYYWARWEAVDPSGNLVGLPQNNWQGELWPREATRIVEFWMNTGLDGLIIDAPLYYAGATWAKHNSAITDMIATSRHFAQPEGADLIGWITEGRYNCLQDYALSRGRVDVIGSALESGDPRPIEAALSSYHDAVVEVGGVLYIRLRKREHEAHRHLELATLTAIGELPVYGLAAGSPDAEETWLLSLKRDHSALHQRSQRRCLSTQADDRYYALLKTALDQSERVVAVMNFQPVGATVEVSLSGTDSIELVDLRTQARHAGGVLRVDLPAYGYAFLRGDA
jgi:hypothetical protein